MKKWVAFILVVLTVTVAAFLVAVALLGCATAKIDKAQLDCFERGCLVLSDGEKEWYCLCHHVITDIEKDD